MSLGRSVLLGDCGTDKTRRAKRYFFTGTVYKEKATLAAPRSQMKRALCARKRGLRVAKRCEFLVQEEPGFAGSAPTLLIPSFHRNRYSPLSASKPMATRGKETQPRTRQPPGQSCLPVHRQGRCSCATRWLLGFPEPICAPRDGGKSRG